MTGHESEPGQKRPVSIWKRLSLLVGVFVLAVVVLAVVQHYWQGQSATSRLAQLISDLDESDPGWRLEEIESARTAPPDHENSAYIVRSVRAMPRSKLNRKAIEPIDSLPPLPELLDAERAALLDRELSSVAAALALARKLAVTPRGKYDISHAEDPIATLLPHVQEAREITFLLQLDALNLAQKNKADESLRSCRAALNAGRSFGDEPFMISHLVRIACIAIAISAAERTLALGEPSVEEIARMQLLLELEEAHPTLLVALRGERASLHKMMGRLSDGSISSSGSGSLLGGLGAAESWDEWFGRLMMKWDGKGIARREHPLILEMMSKLIDNARLPLDEQLETEEKVNAEITKRVARTYIARQLLPATSKYSEAIRRKVANVRCMLTLLAVERYRRQQGAWPKTLAELTPKLLKAVPLDPYDGKPLRYMEVPDGVIVYSIGPDRADDGGRINRAHPAATGTDIGYQLWDVPWRRQKSARAK
jgi:hypothetical protein